MGLFLRWLGAFALLSATYNPTPYNYVRWADAYFAQSMPLTLLVGMVLAVGYVIYIGATLRSIGLFGAGLVIAVMGLLVWVLVDFGVLSLQSPQTSLWVGLFIASLILGLGMSWSIIRQRLSGQATVDQVDG